jgi:hypothetical protein
MEKETFRGVLLCTFSILVFLLGILLYFISFSYSTSGDSFNTSNKRDRFGYKLLFSGILLTSFGSFLVCCNCYILASVKLANFIWPEQEQIFVSLENNQELQIQREQYELAERRNPSGTRFERAIRNTEENIEVC